MPKNIVICCDGTGNEVGARAYSNVAKFYFRLDKSDPTKQLVFYDPGLGTIGAPGFQTRLLTSITRIWGLAFGYGLKQNMKEAYGFLMRHYEPGDQVYLFGFSRGAYTVRALAGMLHRCGLLKVGNENLIDHAISRYFEKIPQGESERAKKKQRAFWKSKARFKKHFSQKCFVSFIGVWDTVKSVGIFRRSLILPNTANLSNVRAGRHAVSLDEKRSKYRPNLWDHSDGAEFKQMWFPGVHSNVGGGYENAGLSDIALTWMIEEVRSATSIRFDESPLDDLAPDPMGKLENPLWPFWWILGWWLRRPRPSAPGDSILLHPSVCERAKQDPQYLKKLKRQMPPGFVCP